MYHTDEWCGGDGRDYYHEHCKPADFDDDDDDDDGKDNENDDKEEEKEEEEEDEEAPKSSGKRKAEEPAQSRPSLENNFRV